jgi:hypothetical protein
MRSGPARGPGLEAAPGAGSAGAPPARPPTRAGAASTCRGGPPGSGGPGRGRWHQWGRGRCSADGRRLGPRAGAGGRAGARGGLLPRPPPPPPPLHTCRRAAGTRLFTRFPSSPAPRSARARPARPGKAMSDAESDDGPELLLKIIFVGDSGVGKTSLIEVRRAGGAGGRAGRERRRRQPRAPRRAAPRRMDARPAGPHGRPPPTRARQGGGGALQSQQGRPRRPRRAARRAPPPPPGAAGTPARKRPPPPCRAARLEPPPPPPAPAPALARPQPHPSRRGRPLFFLKQPPPPHPSPRPPTPHPQRMFSDRFDSHMPATIGGLGKAGGAVRGRRRGVLSGPAVGRRPRGRRLERRARGRAWQQQRRRRRCPLFLPPTPRPAGTHAIRH